MTKDDVNNFALKKNINLNEDELNFTFNFIKKNYQAILANPKLLDINRYQNFYTNENFVKIKSVYQEFYQKYINYL